MPSSLEVGITGNPSALCHTLLNPAGIAGFGGARCCMVGGRPNIFSFGATHLKLTRNKNSETISHS